MPPRKTSKDPAPPALKSFAGLGEALGVDVEKEKAGQRLLEAIQHTLSKLDVLLSDESVQRIISVPVESLTVEERNITGLISVLQKNRQQCQEYLDQNKRNFVKVADDGENIESMLSVMQQQYEKLQIKIQANSQELHPVTEELGSPAAYKAEATSTNPEQIQHLITLIINRDYEAFCKDESGRYKSFMALKNEMYAMARSLGDTDESMRAFLTPKIIALYGTEVHEANQQRRDTSEFKAKMKGIHELHLKKFRNYLMGLQLPSTSKSQESGKKEQPIGEIEKNLTSDTNEERTAAFPSAQQVAVMAEAHDERQHLNDGNELSSYEVGQYTYKSQKERAEKRAAKKAEKVAAKTATENTERAENANTERASLEQEKAEIMSQIERLHQLIADARSSYSESDPIVRNRKIEKYERELAKLRSDVVSIDKDLYPHQELLEKAKQLALTTDTRLGEGLTLEDGQGLAWLAKEAVRKELMSVIAILETKIQQGITVDSEVVKINALMETLTEYQQVATKLPAMAKEQTDPRGDTTAFSLSTDPMPAGATAAIDTERVGGRNGAEIGRPISDVSVVYKVDTSIGGFAEPVYATETSHSNGIVETFAGERRKTEASAFDTYVEKLVALRKEMVSLGRLHLGQSTVVDAAQISEFSGSLLEHRGDLEAKYRALLREAEAAGVEVATLKVEVAKAVREGVASYLEARAEDLEAAAGSETKERKTKIMKWVRRVVVAGALLYPSSVSENQQKVVDASGGVSTATETAPAMPADELRETSGIILPTIPSVPTEVVAPSEVLPLKGTAAEAPTILTDSAPALAYTLPSLSGSEASMEARERTAALAEAMPLEGTTDTPSPAPLRPVEGVVGSAPSVATMPLTPVTGEFTGPSINLAPKTFTVPSLPRGESPMQRIERQTPLEEPSVAEVVSEIETNPPLQAEFLTVQPGSTVSETMLQVFKAGGFNTYFTEQGITLTADEFVALFEKARLIFNADPERIRNEVRMISGNLDLIGHTVDGQPSSSGINAIPLVQEMAQLKKKGEVLTGDDIARADSQSSEDVGTGDVVDADISTIPTTEVITGGETTEVVITSDKIADLAEAYPGGVDGYNTAFLAWMGTLQGSEVAGGYNWLSRMFGPSGFDAYSLFANFNNGNGMTLETLTSIMEGPNRDAKLRDLGIPARPAKLRANFENLYTTIMEVAKDPQVSVTPIMDLTYILWVAFAKEVMEKNAEGLSR